MILHFMRQTQKGNEGYYDKERISQETFDYVSSSGAGTPLGKCTGNIIIKPDQKSGGSRAGRRLLPRGEGTGEEFKEESWVMDSNAAGEPHKGSLAIESYQPSSDTYGIKKNPYSKKETPEKVIRLFDSGKTVFCTRIRRRGRSE